MVGARVVPCISPLTSPYWEGARRHQLCVQRCLSCQSYVHFPRPQCPRCGGTKLHYEQVTGQGLVHTFSVVHRTFAPGFDQRVPYVIAWVDLVERPGLRVFGNVLACPPDHVHIGMPVELCFEELDGFGPLPNFRAASADDRQTDERISRD